MRSPLWFSCLGLALAGGGIVAVALQHRPWSPTPAACLDRDVAAGLRWTVGPWASAIAAAVVGLSATWSVRARRAGPFAICAAVVLAAGLPLLLAVGFPALSPVGLPGWSPAAIGALAVPLVLAAIPLLAERGLLSLAAVSAVAAAPFVVAWRQAQLDAHAAVPLSAVANAVAGRSSVALMLEPGVDAVAVQTVALRLQPPWSEPTRLLAAQNGSVTGQWLRRMEPASYRFDGRRCEPMPITQLPLLHGELQVHGTVVRDADGAITSLDIRCERAGAGWYAVVYTPVGALPVRFDGAGRAALPEEERARLQRWLAPMPPGTAIRILVVPPAMADEFGWTELRT